MSCIIISLMRFWSKPTLWYTDPCPLQWTSCQWICTNHPRQNQLPCLPIRNMHYQSVHCQWLCLLQQKRPRPQKNQRLITQLSHIRTDHLAHPEELSKQPEDQTFCGYEEPCNMPCLGSTANGHESPPSCTTGQHAIRLLQNQESPIAIHHRQQDCYTPLQSSKESMTIYLSWWPQEILCPLPPCLGLCPTWQGGHVPILHPKTSPLVKRFVQDVSPWHKSHPGQAPRHSSISILWLKRNPPDNVVRLTATMRDWTSQAISSKTTKWESTLMKWTKRISLLIHQWTIFSLYFLLSYNN